MATHGSSRQNALPIDVPEGFHIPAKTQWSYRPQIWRDASPFDIYGDILSGTELGPLVTLHHDGDGAALSIRRPEQDASALDINFDGFEGGFFSLAFELPETGIQSLAHHDLIRVALKSTAAEAFVAYVRLNLRHGPNNEQITRMIDIGDGDSFAEFDVFYTEFNPNRVTSVWVDLIINNPAARKITFDEVVILRRARASL